MSRIVRGVAALSAALGLLAGCASPDGIQPVAQRVEADALGLRADGGQAVWPQERWWTRYQDAQLDALVARALDGNPSVAIAAARLANADSAAESAEANRAPQVGAALDSTRQRYTETGAVPAPLAGRIATNNALLLNLSWELDLFGRNRAALDAALGAARAARADLQAARVLLATQVVRQWFELAGALTLRAVASEALAQQQETVALLRARADAGLDGLASLRRAEAGPAEVRRQIAMLDERIALTRHALAALTLQPAEALAGLSPTLPRAGVVTAPTAIPADLIGRRADIVAARWRVEASLRTRDVAATQFYPNVNLAAFAGFSSLGASRWFESGSTVFGAGPAVRLPIFDAGRLRANLKGRTADVDAAVQAYNGVVADAVRDVADHVASLKAVARQATQQAVAQRATEAAHALAAERARAGLENRLAVLQASAAVLAQKSIEVELRTRALGLDAGLARALGGGLNTETIAAR